MTYLRSVASGLRKMFLHVFPLVRAESMGRRPVASFSPHMNTGREETRNFVPCPPSQYDGNLSYEEWMIETIAFFRSIGFFSPFNGLSDLEVLDQLHDKEKLRFVRI